MFCLCNLKTSGKLKYFRNHKNVAKFFHETSTHRQFYSIQTKNRVRWQKKENLLCDSRSINSAVFTVNDSKYESVALPQQAKVVICGGGVMGAAVAYHLGLQGWGKDTVILDQSRVGGGMTWHSSGLVGAFKPSYSQVLLAQQTISLYQDLTQKGLETGWKQCGSLNLARTRDRMTQFRRMKSQSHLWGIECEVLTPDQCREKCSILETSDVLGGLWIPQDGVADPQLICDTLISEAIKMGVTVIENCGITEVLQKQYKVIGVNTERGRVDCDYFVNCAGFWSRSVGQLSKPPVKMPIQAAEHYFLHTKLILNLDPITPVVRDLDGKIYIRENNGSLLGGGFELVAKPAFSDGAIPTSTGLRTLPVDWDHFYPLLQELIKRVPILKDTNLEGLTNGPEAFSPDCKWILGESPEIKNYLVAAGMKTVGISAAGGAGKAIADLITQGFTTSDLYELDISRFLPLHNNRKFLLDRVCEVPGMHFGIPYPFHEFKTGRNLRMSPIYPVLKADGAVFGQTMGYERPNYFDPSVYSSSKKSIVAAQDSFKSGDTNTFSKPHWFDLVAQEYEACREKIGIADYSSFTKLDLWSNGREVVDVLQRLCSNDVDIPIGHIIHTGMQNEHGGYENDCSFARLAENYYMMIAPTIQQTRCKTWITRHLPLDGSVQLSDVTSVYTAICILGPFTRLLLSELTETDLTAKNFPFFTFKELDVGSANGIRTMNLTHTGELGYVLYVPNEFALHVYSKIWEAGQKYGIKHAGHYATRTLRIEKFYAYWGQDLDTFTTPLECGRSWRVKFDKGVDFIGKEALLKQRDEGVKRMYVQLLLNDHDPDIDMWSWGGEPILRNGHYCGQTTTTGWGFTFKKPVCLGFVKKVDEDGHMHQVTNEYILSGDYEVEIAGIRYPAKVNLHSPNLPTKYPDKERAAYKATSYVSKNEEQSPNLTKPKNLEY